jgi:hypothetical protein
MSSGDSFLASRKKKDVGAPLIETGLAQIGNWNPKAMDDGREKIKTQRNQASAQMLVSSTDRYKTTFDRVNLAGQATAADWTLNNQRAALYGYFTRLALTQIQWQWNTPTIVEGKNDILLLDIAGAAGATIAAELNPGFYTPTTLAAEMQRAILAEAAGTTAGVTVTFTNGRFVLTAVTAAYTLAFVATDNSQPGDDPIVNKTYLTIGATTTDTPAAVITTGIPQMLYSRYYDILSTKLTTYQKVKDASTNPSNTSQEIIARVYAIAPNTTTALTTSSLGQPFILNVSYPVPKSIRWSPNQAIADFDIRVIDEYGEPMYWSGEFATEYQMTFLASED